jgi:uncharacterized membrane protein YfcA
MSAPDLAATLAILAVAGFAQGVFGLGFAMIATPLLALYLDYTQAVFLVAVPLFVLAVYYLVRARQHLAQTPSPFALVAGIVLGAAIGVWLHVSLPERIALILLAALLVFSVVVPRVVAGPNGGVAAARRGAPAFGLMAGITESALNVGAPFMVLLGGLARYGRVQQLIALNLCFAFGKAIQLGLLTTLAGVPAGAAATTAAVAVSLIAYRIGDRYAGRWDGVRFRLALDAFLLVMALALVVRGLASGALR